MIRKITSLTLAWMFILSAISGLILYIAPPGRIAYWANWSIFGLSKNSWDHLHTVMTILMISIAGLHLYYNWKPFVSYMKDKINKTLSATKELMLSLVIVMLIALGSLTQIPPFGWIIDLGDYVSEEWEVTYGSPPYNHAELDTLKVFCKRLNLDLQSVQEKLAHNNMTYTQDDTLLAISAKNAMSPQAIYEMIVEKGENKTPAVEGSGMGNKTLEQICKLRGLDLQKVQQILKAKGITANTGDKFKEIAAAHSMHPMELLKIIEGVN